MNTQQLKEMDQAHIAPTYGRFDLAVDHGSGAVCVDREGKEYIDFTAGIGVNSLGFCDSIWIQAVTDQLGKLQHISNLYYTEPQIRLAQKLTARTGMAKVFFCNSGAEANEVAIKTARKFGSMKLEDGDAGADAPKAGSDESTRENDGSTGDADADNTAGALFPAARNTIITLEDSFHGRTMATITATGQEHYHEYFTPFLDGFVYARPNDSEQMQALLENTPDVCAVMIELIQGEGGVNDLTEAYAQAVQKLCREHGVLLIIDEVQTGIGRTGSLFAYQQYHLQPDIVTFAKGIGGGLPLGGALFAESTCDILQPGDHGSTFGGNPAVCAGALAVLDRLDEAQLAEITAKGDYIRARLAKHPQVTELTGRGLMIGITLKDKKPGDVLAACLANGLLVLTAGNRLRLLPPLTITREELDRGLAILEACLG